MRFLRGPGVILGAAAILLGLPAVGHPADMPVPADTQVPLLLKILTYDRNLASKTGSDLVVGVVFDSGNRASAAAADKVGTALYAMKGRTVKGRPLKWFAVEYTGAADLEKVVRSKGIGVFYLTPGNDANVVDIVALSRRLGVTSMTGVPDYVRQGISIGVGYSQDRPQILINLSSARAERSDLDASLLRIATIVGAR
jgi:hypothetical protein